MATMATANTDPMMVKDKLSQVMVNKDANKQERKAVEDMFQRWNDFQQSEQGLVVSRLVDPFIIRVDRLLSTPLAELQRQYPNICVEALTEKRCEWRGQKEVWLLLKYEHKRLRKLLIDLDNLSGGKPRETASWHPMKAAPKKKRKNS